jgi:alkylation response protein AidB-like acyl-CoA dehydrogenase
VDFAYSAAEEAFRAELRAWLAAELPAHRARWPPDDDEFTLHPDRSFDACHAWHRRLHRGSWVGLHWPRAYGGRGATLVEQMIFQEEMVRAGAPPGVNTIGLMLAGPAIMEWGTEAQKRRHLPAMLAADELWCQGFSEPGAGSDLAALRTRAVLDGDHFRVSGQKVWTSHAHRAQWCILLARTDPAAARHDGISCLLVDMASPGIRVRPLVQITGDAEFNEVFFDDVGVPRARLLGPLHGGWKVAITVLMYERTGLGNQTNLHHFTRLLLDLARRDGPAGRPAADPVTRQALAQCWIDAEALRLTGLRALTRRLRGESPGPEGSVTKLAFTEAYARMADTAAALLGLRGQLWRDAPDAVDGGRWAFQTLFARRFGIAGGTSEIQRSILGERVLGLPR